MRRRRRRSGTRRARDGPPLRGAPTRRVPGVGLAPAFRSARRLNGGETRAARITLARGASESGGQEANPNRGCDDLRQRGGNISSWPPGSRSPRSALIVVSGCAPSDSRRRTRVEPPVRPIRPPCRGLNTCSTRCARRAPGLGDPGRPTRRRGSERRRLIGRRHRHTGTKSCRWMRRRVPGAPSAAQAGRVPADSGPAARPLATSYRVNLAVRKL